MRPADGVRALQIGDGARQTKDPVIAARGQAQLFRRLIEQRPARRVRGGDLLQKLGSMMRSISLPFRMTPLKMTGLPEVVRILSSG